MPSTTVIGEYFLEASNRDFRPSILKVPLLPPIGATGRVPLRSSEAPLSVPIHLEFATGSHVLFNVDISAKKTFIGCSLP